MTDKNPSRGQGGWKQLAKAALRMLLNNWGFKLLALLLAVGLWAGLISQDPSLTREKVFSDVTINVTGNDTIKRNGLIVVSDLSSLLQNATLRVDVPQMQYQNAQSGYYNARIDLSRITQTGVQEVRVLTTNSTAYGSVSEISPATLEIEVEEYITRYRIPVTVDTVGTVPDGYYATNPSLDPPLVAVSGPRSLVDRVVRAEAVLDLSTLPTREGLVRSAIPFRLLDEQGNAVESSLLEVTSESVLMDSVVVEQTLYSIRTMPLSDVGLITGTPANGYEIKSVAITPEQVTAAGRESNLAVLDTLYPDSSVSVEGASQSFNQQVKVRKPSELVYLSSDSITVAVEIGPVIRERTFEDVRVTVDGVENGLKADLSVKNADVTITGAQLWVEALKGNALTLVCDASGLAEGTYQLPVICQVAGSDGQTFSVEVVPETIAVTISSK
ncbi:MAG: CdaR family protein [Eubacteriales bacterium]|nr:CdaR family protein [Eubacteriales bacterium]